MASNTIDFPLHIGSGAWTFWTHTWFGTWYCWTGWFLVVTYFFHLLQTTCLNNSIIICIQDKANPFATVLSAAMLLKYGLEEEKAAQRIENAVLDTLNRGFRTGDIYSTGTVSNSFITTWMLKKLRPRFNHTTDFFAFD